MSSNLSPSSRGWLARQSRDPYVRLRLSHPASYRSRSAFKLLELEKKWGGFLSRSDVQVVVDLGAAPGGWSQVVAEKLGWVDVAERSSKRESIHDRKFEAGARRKGTMNQSLGVDGTAGHPTSSELYAADLLCEKEEPTGRGTILALDLLPMEHIPGVRTLQLDFLQPSTVSHLSSLLPGGRADVVLSDMAPNMSGNKVRDAALGREICEAVWNFARRVLTRGKGVLL